MSLLFVTTNFSVHVLMYMQRERELPLYRLIQKLAILLVDYLKIREMGQGR